MKIDMEFVGNVLTTLAGVLTAGYGVWLAAYGILEIRNNF